VLTAYKIIHAWELGWRKSLPERAAVLLAQAFPEAGAERLRVLSVGQRNALLLLLRQKTLGAQVVGLSRCPRCGTRLEFTFDIRALLPSWCENELPTPPQAAETIYALEAGGCALQFRVPTSLDLALVARCNDQEAGRNLLIARCVVEATQHKRRIEAAQLPAAVIQALGEAISEHDPLAEMKFALDCALCQHSWILLFDIVAFFWTELDALARRLLRDVHALASAYGWRERDILALSAVRRQFYLELIH
jgi:hypothetical protein